ncbi:docking protein 1 isoform X1 [Solea solea]|uniref:docking protein 1 isoform X1 n=1 Tax=Solea solea TaxID=90069 RepID=UPI00272A2E4F|nr:docking protein 1 isoform X1 [Solea solea]
MDSLIKTGTVYLQPHKTGRKWKAVLLSLFPHSSSGVGRLEIVDVTAGGATGDYGGVVRKHQPHAERKLKVVRLSELISVLRLPPNAEACPMENMSAFCVEAQDRTMVFAALKDDCVDWVEKLCHSSFPRGGGGSGSNLLHMEENQIYASADKASDFWVGVQRTDAATRCGLQGSYWLQVGREALCLRDTQKQKSVVWEWPYELLRRYGKDKVSLTIEAGRRCVSGPGTFTFETQQAEKIFSLIQSTIKQKTTRTQRNQNQEDEKVNFTNKQPHSLHPKIPDVTSVAAILEKDLRTNERTEEDLLVPQAQPAPITLMPLPSIPTQDGVSEGQHSELSDPVYDDPADCILSIPTLPSSTALYVDPACVLPLKPPKSEEPVTAPPPSSTSQPRFDIHHPDSEYSEVFDKVAPLRSRQAIFQSKAQVKPFADDKVIYAEPMTAQVSHKSELKPDPFAHLYAQVCKKTPSSGPLTSSSTTVTANTSTTKDVDSSLEDVIYENLGII